METRIPARGGGRMNFEAHANRTRKEFGLILLVKENILNSNTNMGQNDHELPIFDTFDVCFYAKMRKGTTFFRSVSSVLRSPSLFFNFIRPNLLKILKSSNHTEIRLHFCYPLSTILHSRSLSLPSPVYYTFGSFRKTSPAWYIPVRPKR